MKTIPLIVLLSCIVTCAHFSQTAKDIVKKSDEKARGIPSLTYNVAQNFDTDLVIQSFFASYPTRFKAQGTSVFLRFKWSFS